MNVRPATFTRIDDSALRGFVAAVFERSSVPPEQAAFLADLLVTNDLRGVFSHGTRQVTAYVGHFREGRLNPAPDVSVVSDSPATLVVNGDGGLGYFAAYRAAELLVPKALETGIAAAVTRNHGHIGAAGIYARVPLERGLFGYVTSGHQLKLKPEQTILHAAGGSPMAFALPTGEEPPFVLDVGVMHDLYAGSKHVDEIIALAPGTVFRSLGLGAVCQALGGFLAGVPLDPERDARQWPGASQGSFQIVVDLARFFPLDAFKAEMDAYARAVRQMKPLAGFEEACLAGTPEWESEREYREEGIPVSPEHAEALRKLAGESGIDAPI
ncbi:MAG TPA: Ldh family oxidoreductase [Armatimonadaceae bacterium]|nr:Ldh family oxidoreductase [Armatimonadaceae bacterium]